MGISDDGLLGANAVVMAGMLIFLTVNSVLNFGSGPAHRIQNNISYLT
jgi:hypothetical protein